MSAPPEPSPILSSPAWRVRHGQVEDLVETLAVEAPFELRVNGRSHSIVMVSPTRLAELALGYCLSEGLVAAADEVLGVELGSAELPGVGLAWWADVALPPELARRAKVRRVAPAATSCALCGLESLRDLRTDIPPLAVEGPFAEMEAVFDLLGAMERGQKIFAVTGATHAAALGTAQGELVSLAEDLGRHNALDKAIGLAVAAGHDPGRLMAVLSGRMSYEMALKAARVGIPLVASVSAPTGLSLRLMADLGLTLVGFGRPPRATVYTHPQRVTLAGVPLAALPEK
jgi:FdhD protein